MSRKAPEWFEVGEIATSEVMKRVADAVESNSMSLQVKSWPMLAHWFMLDSLVLANRANREGMHANALALTRQCIEAIGVLELGMCGHAEAETALLKWDADNLSPGKLRAWLQENVWPSYGVGLWDETWAVFMREFASAIQPYAHYGPSLAQWQFRLCGFSTNTGNPDIGARGCIEIRPRAYDPQKATRISLFHALLTYVLGRIWIAAHHGDKEFEALVGHLGSAVGKSRYLDGHSTDWSQQFWAMLWSQKDGVILE